MRSRRVLTAAIGVWCACALHAAEGKWTPEQVLQLDANGLKQMGLKLPVSRLWDPKRGTGLLSGAIALPGCSASFVSATGLILTNHHCLFGLIQEHSTPERDLIATGFLAKTRDEELPGKTTRITVPRKFTDVTSAMQAAIPANADDAARRRALEAKSKTLVGECEKTAGSRCNVAIFDGGLQYTLIETMELSDIRLVYAPPRAIGEFGGEPDNFHWPRHVGDFAMARAYKDGKPYVPEFYFPVARTGVKPGTSELWETENGPQGGDEVNVIKRGKNYGWPLVTYGRDYDGKRVSDRPWREEFESPELFWVPSITASGISFYNGDKFPAWKGNLFVGRSEEHTSELQSH